MITEITLFLTSAIVCFTNGFEWFPGIGCDFCDHRDGFASAISNPLFPHCLLLGLPRAVAISVSTATHDPQCFAHAEM